MFFIIGCARSGTTAIANILGKCTNAKVGVELKPNLCIESRDLYDGRNTGDPNSLLLDVRKDQIREVESKGLIFADKNVNYLPFIPHMEELWSPNYLFVFRDGRDVVRSLMDWHEFTQGNVFGMKVDDPKSEIENATQDWWDYSRLRPRKGELHFESWSSMSRFEKCSWYWNRYNLELWKAQSTIPDERKLLVNMSDINSPLVKDMMIFLKLDELPEQEIDALLNKKINSSKDKYNLSKKFPDKSDWSDELNNSFLKYASEMDEIIKSI